MDVAISVVIAIYKNLEYLDLVLESIERQSFRNFEVIVAEDAQEERTSCFIDERRVHFSFPIRHVSQQDSGFRKNRIMNRAIRESDGGFIVFIDGDCVLHKHFLRGYRRNIKPNTCLYGRRVELDETTTREFLNQGAGYRPGLFTLWRNRSKKVEESVYFPYLSYLRKRDSQIAGSNFGLQREDLYRVNGFDEDYETICVGEDVDIEWRLRNCGIKFKFIRNEVVQYHLHHEKGHRGQDALTSYEIFSRKQREGLYFCKNGLVKQ